MRKLILTFFVMACLGGSLLLQRCVQSAKGVNLDVSQKAFDKLSDYRFFVGDIKELKPNERVIPYDLNSSLFTDYAEKARFVWMPNGTSAEYHDRDEVLDLPTGAVLIKNFFYHNDETDLSKGRKVIETRLLVNRGDKWDALTYVWNDEQTDAFVTNIGDLKKVSWINEKGTKMDINYVVPDKNQCKSCHEYKGKLIPIGPKVRNINKFYEYEEGKQNQLEKWASVGYLTGFDENAEHPRTVAWDNPEDGTLHQRAMAYLDINCGHCHNPNGPGGVSGLNLSYYNTHEPTLGICKSPVSAGKGSGGNHFDIVPGQPDKSILVYRMETTDPGAMMPEVGRTITHVEGLELIKEWVLKMEGNCNLDIMR